MVANVKIIKKVEGRVDRRNGGVLNRLLRVTAYARVSTDDEDQRNSYQSQLMYFKSKIKENSEWIYIDMYADEAITGTLDYKRSNFMRMINDALVGKFDMIITKSISRFARNTVDTLKYVRLLKERNIAVFFVEENINTLEMSSEFVLTILSSVICLLIFCLLSSKLETSLSRLDISCLRPLTLSLKSFLSYEVISLFFPFCFSFSLESIP